jgi:hypothetical protein
VSSLKLTLMGRGPESFQAGSGIQLPFQRLQPPLLMRQAQMPQWALVVVLRKHSPYSPSVNGLGLSISELSSDSGLNDLPERSVTTFRGRYKRDARIQGTHWSFRAIRGQKWFRRTAVIYGLVISASSGKCKNGSPALS